MPLAKFATFALAALLAFGACASEEDARVGRVTRNIGGRAGFQVNFEIEYWPIPSMTGHQRLFINTSNQQRGWSMTSSAQGMYYDKALAVLNAYYHPPVYQAYLNAEGMLLNATQIAGVDGSKSTYGPTQRLFERMSTNLDHWGWTPGYFISIEDYPPTGFVLTLARVMQEIQAGNRDIDALLKMLDDDWEAGRKGNK